MSLASSECYWVSEVRNGHNIKMRQTIPFHTSSQNNIPTRHYVMCYTVKNLSLIILLKKQIFSPPFSVLCATTRLNNWIYVI